MDVLSSFGPGVRVSPFCRKKAASQSSSLAVADGVSGGIPSGAAAIIQFYELGTGRPPLPRLDSLRTHTACLLIMTDTGRAVRRTTTKSCRVGRGKGSRGIKRPHLEGGRESQVERGSSWLLPLLEKKKGEFMPSSLICRVSERTEGAEGAPAAACVPRVVSLF